MLHMGTDINFCNFFLQGWFFITLPLVAKVHHNKDYGTSLTQLQTVPHTTCITLKGL